MAIYRPKTIDDAPARGPERSGGRQRGDFLVSRGMGVAQGKKVDPRRCVQAIEAQPLFGQIKPSRGHVVRALNNTSEEVVANIGGAAQDVAAFRRREGNKGEGMGGFDCLEQSTMRCPCLR
ncbi:hypothetical protein JJE66_27920 [Bradyrhizobium diazoefficiens]|uniref:hypothetical protein n=1 Tax=Bradyrhizobium diazoefficiens TaxID=1355477 RepID=UPI001909DF48|nr:hypothetical protein [Bradyrhizobium diazoefficiens]MBK3665046.1 hypothetical protein [Bradyrhizobium diazoefficiens]